MNRKKMRDEFFETLEVDEQLKQSTKLANWANAYVNAADAAGEEMDLDSLGGAWYSPVAGTIKLICDLWPYCEWPTWLTWQRYGGPRRRGPWWIAEFDYPVQWNKGSMILRSPWRFAFSGLMMASDQPGVQLTFRTPRNALLSHTEIGWLVRAVVDGMRYDYDDKDFALICQKGRRSLSVDIWQRNVLDDQLEANSQMQPKIDAEGIYWFRDRSDSTRKTVKTKRG